MNTRKQLRIYVPLLVIVCIIVLGLWYLIRPKKLQPKDYSQIKKEGVLRVVTTYNSIDYYVSGDTIKGLQYDLCKAIEKISGLRVEIYLENNLENSIKGLERQEYDIIARNIPVTSENTTHLCFTNPISLERQVLVQRTAEHNNNIPLIRNQIDLAKKTIHIPFNSPGILRLHNLAEEIGDTIYIQENEKYDSEQLLYMVARNEIDYAMIDREIALKNKDSFPQIDILTDISFTQLRAWALRKDAPVLLDSLNSWLEKYTSVQGEIGN